MFLFEGSRQALGNEENSMMQSEMTQREIYIFVGFDRKSGVYAGRAAMLSARKIEQVLSIRVVAIFDSQEVSWIPPGVVDSSHNT